MSVIKLYFDGACGKAGKIELISYGVVGYKNEQLCEALCHSQFAGYGTNNMAEWEGLKKSLELLYLYYLESGKKDFTATVVGDSQLIVYQFTGKYQVRQPHLKGYYQECQDIYNKFPPAVRKKISVVWTPRENNKEADKAAGIAMKNYLKTIL